MPDRIWCRDEWYERTQVFWKTMESPSEHLWISNPVLHYYLTVEWSDMSFTSSDRAWPFDIPNLISVIRRLHFDHFIPQMKRPTYSSAPYRSLQPVVVQINPEKKSGVSSIGTVTLHETPSVISIWIVRRDSFSEAYTSDIYMSSCVWTTSYIIKSPPLPLLWYLLSRIW